MSLTSRLNVEERLLIRQIGTAFMQILQGRLVKVPESDRRDELGLLAGIANRVGTEILKTRERDAKARPPQNKPSPSSKRPTVQRELLSTIRSLSSPVLHIHPGRADTAHRGDRSGAQPADCRHPLEQVVALRAKVVILDLTSAVAGDARVTELIARQQRYRTLGARTILRVSPEFARWP